MADIQEEIRSLTELLDEVTKASVMLRGTQANPGLIQQLYQATETAREMIERLGATQAISVQIKDLAASSKELPEHLISNVDSAAFRAALSRVIVELTGAEIEKMQKVQIDHLFDELKFQSDRLAEDVFTKKIEPAFRSAEAIARLKQDREDYRVRAEKAEKALADFQGMSKKAEESIADQIERIRLSATKPNRWLIKAWFLVGAIGGILASSVWELFTTWLLGQPIPFPLPWR